MKVQIVINMRGKLPRVIYELVSFVIYTIYHVTSYFDNGKNIKSEIQGLMVEIKWKRSCTIRSGDKGVH